MLEEYEVMIMKFMEFKKSLADFEYEAGSVVLYKLLAFDVVEEMVLNLDEQLADAQEVLKKYSYEN
jgi:hypothetical protein